MTVTQSPQSVVVPVGPKRVLVLKSAVERLILAADMYGVAHLDSDDMDDDAVELQDATEGMKDALASAPAPSSLAGGEGEIEVIARAIDPDAWAHIDACHEAMKTCGENKLADFRKVIERRLRNSESIPAAERVIASLAALSPEAPAREGEWFGVTGAADETEALAVALFDARCPGIRMTDEDLHYYRAAAQRAMKAVADELDTPALTPRHEAQAPTCQKCGGEVQGWTCQECGASFRENDEGSLVFACHEAPAEPVSDRYRFDDEIAWLREAARYFSARDTKGEDRAHWANVYNAENARKLADRLAELSSNPCQLEAPAEGAGEREALAAIMHRNMIPDEDGGFSFHDLKAADQIMDYLRARSSAPEASEEALGNLLAVIHGDGGHRALEVGTKQAALEAEKIVAGLFAAPSADKLREDGK